MNDKETIKTLEKTVAGHEETISDLRAEVDLKESRIEELEEEVYNLPDYHEGRSVLIEEIHQQIVYQDKDLLDVGMFR